MKKLEAKKLREIIVGGKGDCLLNWECPYCHQKFESFNSGFHIAECSQTPWAIGCEEEVTIFDDEQKFWQSLGITFK